MASRQVRKTGKNDDKDITRLCNAGETWSPRSKAEAIGDIESKTHSYFVSWPDGKTTDITVVNGKNGKYLRTQKDGSTRNNLEDLDDC